MLVLNTARVSGEWERAAVDVSLEHNIELTQQTRGAPTLHVPNKGLILDQLLGDYL